MTYEIIHGDCLDVLRGMDDASVDAIVTDPPYGISQDRGMGGGGFDGFGGGKRREPKQYAGSWDRERPDAGALQMIAAMRVPTVVWGGNHLCDLLPANGKWLVWDKVQTMPTYSDCELAWTNLDGYSVKMYRYNGSGLMSVERERFHPTQKPVALMRWCIEKLKLPEGATILDPFCGSGSTGVAAIQMGYDFIGIEREADYCEIARKRIAAAAAQGNLFHEVQ